MNLNFLKDFFSGQFWSDPQRLHSAHNALAAIEAGIAELAKLGHSFDLVQTNPANQPAPEQFPKMLYKKGATTIVDDLGKEGQLMADGWTLTPEGESGLRPPVPVEVKPAAPPADSTPVPSPITKSFIPEDGPSVSPPVPDLRDAPTSPTDSFKKGK